MDWRSKYNAGLHWVPKYRHFSAVLNSTFINHHLASVDLITTCLDGGSCHDFASATLWQKTEVPKLFTGWLSLGHLFFMNLSSAHWKNSGGGGDYQPHSLGPSWESTEVHMAKVFCKMRRTVQMRLHSKDVIGFSWFCQLQRWLTMFSVFSQFLDLSAKQIKTKIFTNMLWIRLQPVWLSDAIMTQCGNSLP